MAAPAARRRTCQKRGHAHRQVLQGREGDMVDGSVPRVCRPSGTSIPCSTTRRCSCCSEPMASGRLQVVQLQRPQLAQLADVVRQLPGREGCSGNTRRQCTPAIEAEALLPIQQRTYLSNTLLKFRMQGEWF